MENEELCRIIPEVRQGNRGAFAELYTAMKTPVYTIAVRITRSKAAAEDVMQDVFVRLWENPPGDDVRNPGAWICRMAHNAAVNCIRRRAAAELPEDAPDAGLPVEEQAGMTADVERAMRTLSEEETGIVTLHVNCGLKFREISEILSQPAGTVFRKYRGALNKLKKQLR